MGKGLAGAAQERRTVTRQTQMAVHPRQTQGRLGAKAGIAMPRTHACHRRSGWRRSSACGRSVRAARVRVRLE